MILGFKKQFVKYIKAGTKIHTIRQDKYNRWKAGRTIQMATGVRTKKYKCFNKKHICKSFQNFQIVYYNAIATQWVEVFIDERKLLEKEIIDLAICDGFKGMNDFFHWFNKSFKGKIIHWTDKKYYHETKTYFRNR